jgi:hypothetical protein
MLFLLGTVLEFLLDGSEKFFGGFIKKSYFVGISYIDGFSKKKQ